MEHEIPKKLGVLAAHGDEEPPKTLDAHYVKDIMHYFNNPKKNPFNLLLCSVSQGPNPLITHKYRGSIVASFDK